MTTLPISDIVEIDTIISPVAPPTQERRTLFLTRDASVLDAGGSAKIKQYGNFNELSRDFDSGSAPYAMGQIYFAQTPFPRELAVGRWAETAQVSQIRGGAPAAVQTRLQATTGIPTGTTCVYDATTGRFTINFA